MMFPIYLPCNIENGWSHAGFRSTFMQNKPAKLIWYAYDVWILNKTLVRFDVFEMYDDVYGGVGNKIHTFEVEVDESITRPEMVRRAMEMARAKREAELEAAENLIVHQYAKEILALED